MKRFQAWVRSPEHRSISKSHQAISGSDASIMFLRQDHAFGDPATDDLTLQLLVSGALHLRADLGVRRFEARAQAGDIVVAPDRVPSDLEGEGLFELLVLALPGASLHRSLAEAAGVNRVDLSPLHSRLQEDPQIATAMRWLWDEAQAGSPMGRLYADGLLAVVKARLLGLIGRSSPDRIAGLSRWQKVRLVEYMEAHVADDIALSDMARVVGLTESHFCRSFKRAFGASPIQRLTQQRIERAKQHLAEGRLSVQDVAQACGYAEPGHFSRVFRRMTGLTPSAWRRQAMAP